MLSPNELGVILGLAGLIAGVTGAVTALRSTPAQVVRRSKEALTAGLEAQDSVARIEARWAAFRDEMVATKADVEADLAEATKRRRRAVAAESRANGAQQQQDPMQLPPGHPLRRQALTRMMRGGA